jgi:hypothetical protein
LRQKDHSILHFIAFHPYIEGENPFIPGGACK